MKHIKIIAFSILLSVNFIQGIDNALINAALHNDIQELDTLIALGMDINHQNKFGDTPLMTIIKIRDHDGYNDEQIIKAVQILLDKGANYETANNDGNNPLLKVVSCSSSRNKAILDILLYKRWLYFLSMKRDINIEVRDKHGNTPLIRAAGADNNSPKNILGNSYAVHKLLTFGANINAINNQGYTALGRAVKDHQTAVIELLQSRGAILEKTKSQINDHPFIIAAHEGDIETMQKLLDEGTDINMQNKDGRTALFIVTAQGNVQAVKFLLEHDADPDRKNSDGNNPLLKAVKLPLNKNAIEIITLLRNNHANFKVKDKYGDSVCKRAQDPVIIDFIQKQCPHKK